jgi:prepilin-type N-terminal cleavage/methylation domain-containing protein
MTRPQGAFTVLEVLICMSIIAIVAAITFPVVSRAKEQALISSATQNLRQVHLATMLYRNEYEGSEHGSAEQMGLPSAAAYQGLYDLFESTPNKGRSPCSPNAALSGPNDAIYNLFYHPIDEMTWRADHAKHGEQTWLFKDLHCDFRDSYLHNPYALHRVIFVSLGGSAKVLVGKYDPTKTSVNP